MEDCLEQRCCFEIGTRKLRIGSGYLKVGIVIRFYSIFGGSLLPPPGVQQRLLEAYTIAFLALFSSWGSPVRQARNGRH
eukprot:1847446-Amphidinium_carterae.1